MSNSPITKTDHNKQLQISWEVLSTKHIYRDHWMALHTEEVKHDGVNQIATYGIVDRRPFTVVVPILENGNIVCIRTIRHATALPSLEVCMGFMEDGETPEQGVRRELEEETGWKAGELYSTGWNFVSPAFMTQKCFTFVAKNLTPGKTHLDLYEKFEVEERSAEYMLNAIQTGEISDAPTIISLLKAKQQGFL